VNGLYKTELIYRNGPWRSMEQVELATAAWVLWWNEQRLHEACDYVPPAELELLYYRRLDEAPRSRETKRLSLYETQGGSCYVQSRCSLDLARSGERGIRSESVRPARCNDGTEGSFLGFRAATGSSRAFAATALGTED
jgi:hypothetical protein